MKTVPVSYNEVLQTVHKACEGLGLPPGDCEDIAESVAWLELHGVGALRTACEQLSSWNRCDSIPLIERRAGALLVQNSRHVPTLLWQTYVLDYLFVEAWERTYVQATLRNCRHGYLTLPYLIKCAQRGVCITAQWVDDSGGDKAVCCSEATIPKGHGFPTWREFELGADDLARVVGLDSTSPALLQPGSALLSVTLSTEDEPQTGGNRLPDGVLRVNQVRTRDRAWFESRARHHFQTGIPVAQPVWSTWLELSKAILVAESETSRQFGAGEEGFSTA